VLFVDKKLPEDAVSTDGVNGRYDDAREWLADWDLIDGLCLHPVEPADFFNYEAEVKQARILSAQAGLEAQRLGMLSLLKVILSVHILSSNYLLEEDIE